MFNQSKFLGSLHFRSTFFIRRIIFWLPGRKPRWRLFRGLFPGFRRVRPVSPGLWHKPGRRSERLRAGCSCRRDRGRPAAQPGEISEIAPGHYECRNVAVGACRLRADDRAARCGLECHGSIFRLALGR